MRTEPENSFDLASEKEKVCPTQTVHVGNGEMHAQERTRNAYCTVHSLDRKRSLAPAGKGIRLTKHQCASMESHYAQMIGWGENSVNNASTECSVSVR